MVDRGGAESAAATAAITVTAVADAPEAGALARSTVEDTALTFAASDFAGVFTDADAGDSLKAVKAATLPAAAQGALALDGSAVAANQVIAQGDLGDLVFTPAANWNGDATFTFKVVDQGDAESAAATATITVTAVADAPVAGALNLSTAEDTALTFAASDFAGVFTDADAGDSLKAVKVATLPAAAQGALALDGSAVAANQVIAQGDLGDLVFTPVANWNGAATFTFKVVDQGDAESAAATATITVTAVADAPVAGALNLSTAEDTALTFAASDFAGVFTDADAGGQPEGGEGGDAAGGGAGARWRWTGARWRRAGRSHRATWGTWCSRRWRTGTGMRRSRSRWWTRRARSPPPRPRRRSR